MAEKKITRKELLKEPDEFLTTTGQVIRFSREHTRTVVIACALLVACVLGTVGFYAYQKHREIQSHEMFQQASREYYAAISAETPATPEALDKLLAQFDVVVRDYGSLPAGEMALFYSGHVHYAKEDYKAALERYDRMRSTSLVKSGLGSLVLYHIAMTRMALKDYEKAVLLFDQLSKDTNSPYRREAHAAIARIYELMGKNKEAVQAYKQYLKMFPEAPDAAFVKARIAELSARG